MKRKTILMLSIALLVVVLTAVGTSYALFRMNITSGTTFKIVTGKLKLEISDTEPNGTIVVNDLIPMSDTTGMSQQGYSFTLTNTGSINSSYTMYLDDVIPSGETKTRISDSLIKVNLTNTTTNASNTYTLSSLTNRILEEGSLNAKTNNTNNYVLRIWLDQSATNAEKNKYFAVKIRVDGTQANEITKYTLKDMILADNPTIKTNPTLRSATSSNGESGLYSMNVTNSFGGGSGTTYYFRGDVTNNVVEFAGKIWRIVRINEDDTIRLILDTSESESTYRFNSSYNDYSYMYYSNSGNYIKKTVDDWYTTNITGTNASKVATGNYFCEAAKVKYSSSYTSGSATMTEYSSYTPTLDCTKDGNDKQYVNGSVGLISYDEVVLAGGYKETQNKTYYLYKTASGGENNFNWWTMSPAGFSSDRASAWYVRSSGDPYSSYVNGNYRVRPVINLKANVSVTKDASTGHYIVN